MTTPRPSARKVHKHPQWNIAPNPPQSNPPNDLQLPNFPHTHQLKFSLQYCYYIDGSFTLPKQQANGS
jgi:hypothetical protein